MAPAVREKVCWFPPPTSQLPASARSACCPDSRCTASAEAQLGPDADAPYSQAISVLPLPKAGVLNCSQIAHPCKSDQLWSFPEKQNHTYTHRTVFLHSRSPPPAPQVKTTQSLSCLRGPSPLCLHYLFCPFSSHHPLLLGSSPPEHALLPGAHLLEAPSSLHHPLSPEYPLRFLSTQLSPECADLILRLPPARLLLWGGWDLGVSDVDKLTFGKQLKPIFLYKALP